MSPAAKRGVLYWKLWGWSLGRGFRAPLQYGGTLPSIGIRQLHPIPQYIFRNTAFKSVHLSAYVREHSTSCFLSIFGGGTQKFEFLSSFMQIPWVTVEACGRDWPPNPRWLDHWCSLCKLHEKQNSSIAAKYLRLISITLVIFFFIIVPCSSELVTCDCMQQPQLCAACFSFAQQLELGFNCCSVELLDWY